MPKTGQAMIEDPGAVRAFVFGYINGPLNRAGDSAATIWTGVEGEEGVGAPLKNGRAGQTGSRLAGSPALGRAVDDFPVAQITGSAEGDGAGADSTQRESNAEEVAGIVGLEYGPARVEFGRHKGQASSAIMVGSPIGPPPGRVSQNATTNGGGVSGRAALPRKNGRQRLVVVEMGLHGLPVVLLPAGVEIACHVGRHERLDHGQPGSAVGGLDLKLEP